MSSASRIPLHSDRICCSSHNNRRYAVASRQLLENIRAEKSIIDRQSVTAHDGFEQQYFSSDLKSCILSIHQCVITVCWSRRTSPGWRVNQGSTPRDQYSLRVEHSRRRMQPLLCRYRAAVWNNQCSSIV
ncbi:hypothetical protein PMAYCL1PPCAC_20934, partial [Pristionchus mayeri]